MTSSTPPRLPGEISIHDSEQEVALAAASFVHEACLAAVRSNGVFTVALAGGGIANQIHSVLAGEPWRSEMDWDAWRVYFGDERACPPDDENSNYHQARETLLDHVAIDPGNVHRMPAELEDLDSAASGYADLLASTLPAGRGGAPRLDCILLGLGSNGHTASLFPGTPATQVTDRWVTRGRADYAPFDRMTMTFPTLNAGARVAFAVTGASKRAALQATAAGTTQAARVGPVDGTLSWFLDRAAAGG